MGQPALNSTLKPHSVEAEFIVPFIEETLIVLKGTCETVATKEKVFLRKGNQISGDISAVVAMNSSKFRGSMAITFEKDCLLGAVVKMLGEEYTEINSSLFTQYKKGC